jgi:acyl carrier protein
MEVENRVAEILSVLLKEKIGPGDNVSMDTAVLWDSMMHIQVIMTIEEELDVSFSPEDIPKLTSLQKLVAKIKELK